MSEILQVLNELYYHPDDFSFGSINFALALFHSFLLNFSIFEALGKGERIAAWAKRNGFVMRLQSGFTIPLGEYCSKGGAPWRFGTKLGRRFRSHKPKLSVH